MTLSLVLPCFNEEATIERTVYSCISWMTEKRIVGEVIVVNDGSTDGSGEILQTLKSRFPLLRIVTHATNQGYGIAVRSGCDAALMEWIAFMDSDGQFDIWDMEKLLNYSLSRRERVRVRGLVREGEWKESYNFITGRRRKRADSFVRNCYGKGLGILTWTLFGLWVRDINCGMKVFKRDLWPQIRPVYGVEKMFNTELFLRLKRLGIPWKQVDVSHFPRQGGRPTGASWKVVCRMVREIWNLTVAARGDCSASNLRNANPRVGGVSETELVDHQLVRSR